MKLDEKSGKKWLYFAFLILLWGQLFFALIPSWRDGTYYSYGWLVPPAMVFFYLRRRDEVPPKGQRASSFSQTGVLVFFLVGLLLLLGLRIIEGGNVHWRLPLWAHGGVAIAMSLVAMAVVEGRAAIKTYLPIFVFVLVAIPLPSFLEQQLVSELTAAVTTTGGDIARLVGLPVEIAESAFLVAGHPVDVNDGCSGIRSFQSSLMATLFVGELLCLSLPSRLTLLFVGVAASFLGNSVRVVLLIEAFAEGGREGMDHRHDSVGLAALALTYGIIVGVGFALNRWGPDPKPASLSEENVEPAMKATELT